MKEEYKVPAYIGNLIRFNYVRKYLPKCDGGKLLDAGCGEGDFREMVESKGYKYVGVDINPQSPGIKADVCALPFKEGEFDVVIAIDLLEHVKDDDKAIRELRRVLKLDGRLILHVPHRFQKHILIPKPEEQHDHVREGYDEIDLRNLLFSFKSANYYPTFDKLESVAWDLYFAVTHKIPINPHDLVDEEKWSEWKNYGIIVVAKK